MAYPYVLHPMAQEEYEDSVAWYAKRSLKAAENFVKAVDNGLANICNHPNRYKNEYKHYREHTISKYPFTIVYTFDEDSQLIIIIAVYHQKREPSGKYR